MTTSDGGAGGGIVVDHLSKRYGTTNVLDQVTAHFEPRKIHGVLGRNGAGKTTLMSIICNHSFKTSGTVLIDGVNPAENARALGRTCFIHEDQRWHDVYTVAMIIASARRFYPNWDQSLSERLVSRLKLPLGTKARRISRGQRSALAIVIALSSQAEYTFLDEPYLGLEATARGIFYEELALAQADAPRTFLMSTHLIDESANLLETVTILHRGHVVMAENVDEATANTWLYTGVKEQADRVLVDMEVLSTSVMGPIVSVIFRG